MEKTHDSAVALARKAEERKEFGSYVGSLVLALALTLVPFGLVKWFAMPHFLLFCLIGAFAIMQIIVHLHFFLHIGFRQKREIFYLLLFSTLLLVIMGAGTLWIMGNLAVRMALPPQP